MSTPSKISPFFVVGGPLRTNAPSYVKRSADDELFELVSAGEFAYILTCRQMGKSSLVNRTAQRLKEIDVRTVRVDLASIGIVEIEKWYLGLLAELTRQLHLSVDLEVWWQKQSWLGPVQRFITFLREVVLTGVKELIVIFIDEIDVTLTLEFADDFFAAIRSVYSMRDEDPTFERLVFVLIGAASPTDLIKDYSRTPFNIGQAIDLHEFTVNEAQILYDGWFAIAPRQRRAILWRIFYWTNGHPYLTQKLCSEVAENQANGWNDKLIDLLVEKLFLSEEVQKESNLESVRRSITVSSERRELLQLYRQVHGGRLVVEDKLSQVQNRLRIIGLVRVEGSKLIVRNQIYSQVFNRNWVKANRPTDWKRDPLNFLSEHRSDIFIVAATIFPFLVILAALYFFLFYQPQLANDYVAAFKNKSSGPNERLENLAYLFNLIDFPQSYADTARGLFYGDNLSSGDREALFTQVTSENQKYIRTVVENIYNVPENGWKDGFTPNSELLQAMQLGLGKSGETEQAKEISHWLEARNSFWKRDYAASVISYTEAISSNQSNPATHYELAVTLVKEKKYLDAFDEFFDKVLKDENWKKETEGLGITASTNFEQKQDQNWRRPYFVPEDTARTTSDSGKYTAILTGPVTFASLWSDGEVVTDGVLQVEVSIPAAVTQTSKSGLTFGWPADLASQSQPGYAFAIDTLRCYYLQFEGSGWTIQRSAVITPSVNKLSTFTLTLVIDKGQVTGYVNNQRCAKYEMPDYRDGVVGVMIDSRPKLKEKTSRSFNFDNYQVLNLSKLEEQFQ